MKIKILGIITLVIIYMGTGCKKIEDETKLPQIPEQTNPLALSINLGSVSQTIRGFGGASVWLGALSDTEMNTLYGNDNSNQFGFSILRIRIDPTGAWSDELSNAKKAISHGAAVIATPWTPPAYMKSNNNTIGGTLNPASYTAYATYLKSFADYMSTNGAPLYAIGIQNEPDVSVTYESCFWTANTLLDFVKNSTLDFGTTKVMSAEHSKFDVTFTDPILNDATAVAKIAIIGGHIYGGGQVAYPLAQTKGKEVWMTEHLVNDNDWAGALATAKEIHTSMTAANYNAYLWWYLKRSYGPIDESGNPTKRGYVMGQFSKYIRPGYQRLIANANPVTNIFTSAYKGNNKVVIIAINTGTTTVNQQFSIIGGTIPASFTPHITSESKNISTEADISTASNGVFSYQLPASSITTFVSN